MSVLVEEKPGAPEVKQPSSVYMVFVMTLVATLCGLLIVGAYLITKAPIQKNERQLLREAILGKDTGVMPDADRIETYLVDLQAKTVTKLPEGATASNKFYAGYDAQGKLVGLVLEGIANGYGGPMRAIFNYSPERNEIVALRVLEHKETPGLGDKITSDQGFLDNFKNLAVKYDTKTQSISDPITTVRHGKKTQPWQIDAISGATVSSKAIGRLLAKSTGDDIPIIMSHLDQIRRGE